MEPQNTSMVHFYDTRSRAIACGVRGLDHRSTKHARQVTCPRCVERLQGRAPEPAVAGEPAAAAP